ncbi:hypothetical protein AAMO2058_001025500 [Amorphochlora amoebiformis]
MSLPSPRYSLLIAFLASFILRSQSSPPRSLTSQLRLLGTPQTSTLGHDIHVDYSGNAYITGVASGDVSRLTVIGGVSNPIKIRGITDMMITKFDADGRVVWASLSGVERAHTVGAAVAGGNPKEHVYVAGWTNGGLGGGNEDGIGARDIALWRFRRETGELDWVKQFGVEKETTEAHGIAWNEGNIYVTGVTTGDLGGERITGYKEMFIMKLDSFGNSIWTRLFGAETRGYGIAVESTGAYVYATGVTYAHVSSQQPMLGSADLIMVKVDSKGNRIWSSGMGWAQSGTQGNRLTIDEEGSVFVTGWTDGSFGGKRIGTQDLVAAKFSPKNGEILWKSLLGDSAAITQGLGISTFGRGVYVVGITTGSLGTGSSFGTFETLIAKLAKGSGQVEWTRQILADETGTNTHGLGVAIDSVGRIFVAGWTDGPLEGHDMSGITDLLYFQHNSQIPLSPWLELQPQGNTSSPCNLMRLIHKT